jgi:putative ABC transport system ATP-binding protein
MSLLRLEHASKDYVTDGASVHALRDVSLEVARGEFVALVGRSGCGKSTLLNLAGCMDFPTSGKVILEGVTTSSLNELELTRLRAQKVGFIFQSFQLLPTLSVAENAELPLMLAGGKDARSRALECLRWVEMERYAARRPFQLSGGEMQRVGIARALVHSPSLLLADEPTGNLDTGTSTLILDILRRVSDEKNTTILMATHSSEAAATADTIITLRDGSIEESIRQAKGTD